MKRLAGFCIAGLFLVGATTSHLLWSAPPEGNKQLVCHVSEDEGDHIIEVSVNAVPAHLAHGDCLIGSTDRSLIDTPCDATDAEDDDQCDTQP
jgi:hypothetical protein